MIVGILVVIWLVALTPFAIRRLSEHQIATSVARFRSAVSMLRRAQPRIVAVTSEHFGETEVRLVRKVNASPAHQRNELRRRQRQIERRRRLLFRLVAATFGSLILGAIPHLHLLWVVSIVGVLLTSAYVWALLQIAREPAPLAPARHEVDVPSGQPGQVPLDRVAAAGGSNASVVLLPRRPSFVLIDPRA